MVLRREIDVMLSSLEDDDVVDLDKRSRRRPLRRLTGNVRRWRRRRKVAAGRVA